MIAHSLRAEGFDASEDGTGRGTPLVPVCFSAKDHGADAMHDLSPTLRAGGHSGSHANAGVMPAIAFAIQERAVSENIEAGPQGKGWQEGAAFTLEARNKVQSVAFAHQGGGTQTTLGFDPEADVCMTLSSNQTPAIAGSAVRRLTPRECERLQGFPETLRTVRITVCAGAKSDHARSAPKSSAAREREQSAPVAVRVLIDLEQQRVRLLNLDGSIWSASTVERPSSSPLSMPADDFVRLAAHTIISLVPVTGAGVEASRTSSNGSSPLWSGSASASAFGQEIAELANDAAKLTSEANRLSKFTTLPDGHGTLDCAQTLETWSCCVCAAISGFIPEQIRNAPSYAIEVQLEAGFTLIPYRGKTAADGPRYKALGNSMAVPVMRWIGERIALVDALATVEREAA